MSQSVMMRPGQNNSFRQSSQLPMTSGPANPKIKRETDHRMAEAFDDLPLTYEVRTKETFHKADNCELCNKKFTLTFRSHHCRMCSKSVCSQCSLERRLSQEDKERYHCCNECDFELSNAHARANLKQMVDQRE